MTHDILYCFLIITEKHAVAQKALAVNKRSTEMSGNIWNMRKDYEPNLPFIDIKQNIYPIKIFSDWFDEAKKEIKDDPWEANTMILSTISQDGIPSARCVLLKEFDENGFQFFTNYNSQKASEISNNKNVSLLFYWPKNNRSIETGLFRQIKIQGIASKISYAESVEYFKTRPLKSQISAILSNQSSEISEDDFEKLRKKSEEMYEEFLSSNKSLKMPSHWGGYLVKPYEYEFWQGNRNRFHDRCKYTLNDHSLWKSVRLQP
ncbi:hypothetical protein HZS_4266 [Henneguya salminicola]|nr:hypothetical protein HZS_4266 [Henneguya salminicola]